jgi:hypothetical protein
MAIKPTDLLERLDAAAVALLERALAGDSMQDAFEAFKTASAWASSRAKIAPPPPAVQGGDKFNRLREKLHAGKPNGTIKRGGASSAEAEDSESLDTL